MKMQTYSSRRKKRPIWILGLAACFVVAVLLILLWGENSKDAGTGDSESSADYSQEATINAENITGETENPTAKKSTRKVASRIGSKMIFGPKGMTAELAGAIGPSPITVAKISKPQGEKSLAEGMNLFAANKDLLKARTLLNRAYISGTLPEPQAIDVRKALESLADRTVLAADSYVHPKDPYLLNYTFRPGDMLNSTRKDGVIVRKGVIARFDLNIPADILLKINNLKSSVGFLAGRSYKLIKGPFHLVIYKSKLTADVYLQDLFVRRIPICIGAPETPTPEGFFRLVPHGKTLHSAYNAPAETGEPNYTLLPNDEGYPLDKLGHNMKIEGIPQLGTNILASQSYAIHGTSDQSSIGTAASRGCIRAGDQNIRFLYGILQSYADPKNPKVTWKRWSTVTIRK